VAVVALSLATLARPASSTRSVESSQVGDPGRESAVERELAAAGDGLAGVLVSPRNVRSESREPLAVWTLTSEATDTVLFIDMTGAGSQGRLDQVQVACVADLSQHHRRGEPIDGVSLPASVTAAVVPIADVFRAGDVRPGTWLGQSTREEGIEELKQRALPLVSALRALVDADARPGGPLPDGFAHDDLGALQPLATDEIRRALLRLENLLANRSTRGRKRRSD
jgi:hypothetical protein